MLFSLELIYRFLSGESFSAYNVSLDISVSVILTFFLVWLVAKMAVRPFHVALIVTLSLFVIRYLNNMIEGYFFTSVFPDAGTFAFALIFSAIFGTAAGFSTGYILFKSDNRESLASRISSYILERSAKSWAVRIAAASLVYFPIYFLFGMIVSPFVYPYYSNPDIGLKIPSFTVMIPLEFLRGFIYVIALIPFLGSIRWSRWTAFLAVSMMRFVPGALIPLIQAPLPAQIMPFH